MGNSPKGEYMPDKNTIIKILTIIGIGSVCLFLLGCNQESFLIAKEDAQVLNLEEERTEDVEKQPVEDAEKQPVEETEKQPVEDAVKEAEVMIAVHVCGAVKQPGVYYFSENQRVYQGIEKAGGFLDEADRDYLNQALFLEDGMKIVVPTKEEAKAWKALGYGADEAGLLQGTSVQEKAEEEQKKVNLNTADEALLCTLPGIGQSRAKSILAYRDEHGKFETTEDIMNVSGIKEAAYEKIKDYITVGQ